ncbi:Fur family transcriptional regulator [Silvibacterium sp.]|uniref:Fur family transcriptional regulator n=1 Tax=Silvibacterium sp. TaxID=1964179 RepID=UPI0039E31308
MDKRNTKQKAAIRDAFSEADRPLSPEEALSCALEFHPTIGIATVYRNIQTLVQEGWLTPVVIPGQPPRYELSGKEHHHHFQCNKCGKLYDLKGCFAQTKQRLPKGFSTTGHEFFLYGNCANCNAGVHA